MRGPQRGAMGRDEETAMARKRSGELREAEEEKEEGEEDARQGEGVERTGRGRGLGERKGRAKKRR